MRSHRVLQLFKSQTRDMEQFAIAYEMTSELFSKTGRTPEASFSITLMSAKNKRSHILYATDRSRVLSLKHAT